MAVEKGRHSSQQLAWYAWMEIMQDVYDLFQQVSEKCANVVADIGGDASRRLLRQWREHVKKKKLALKRWKNSSLQKMFDAWAGGLAEFWAIMVCGGGWMVVVHVNVQVRANVCD